MAKNLKKAKSFRFTDEELEILDALQAKYKTYSAGIIAAAKNDLAQSETDWPTELRRLANILESEGGK